MAAIQVESNGQFVDVTKDALFKMAADGVITQETKIRVNGVETIAGRAQGIIFCTAKMPEQSASAPAPVPSAVVPYIVQIGMTPNTNCVLMHVMALLCFPLSFILWMIAKDGDDFVDAHGKIIMNWICSVILLCIITVLLYAVEIALQYSSVRSLAVVGNEPFVIFLLHTIPNIIVTLYVSISLVFPIIGAAKAAQGKVWRYPFSFPIFSVEHRIKNDD
ncbi:MAG: DUF4870 domain-containing protein [Planctomycetaceae bacterium]|jgi:uncharacterized Tic20 family protein|nr:DUF4870 domain-containing protein [Planctomycetaceae bacterium]